MRWQLLTALVLTGTLAGQAQARNFGFDTVIAQARELAQKPYQAPPQVPKFIRDLSFARYQDIRFNPDKSLWRDSHSRFQVMLVSPGLYYKHAVKIHVVNAEGVHTLGFDRDLFTYPSNSLKRRIPPDLGYAGFKLTFPLKNGKTRNQFLVFAGATYFRGVGRDNNFGLSGRGIAVDTGLPAGEQFPSFTEFWLERPAPNANAMKFFALLDGKSLSGAYQFTVYPGKSTQLRVKAVLFPRQNIKLLGIAPLTSMFYYGENTSRPRGEWRKQVHDSDGLLIHNGQSGEWLWRPLINPKTLKMDYFQTDNIQGFGLLQRQRKFTDYEDLGARYEARPSAWIDTEGQWGKGSVVLVELPTDTETNDNIVAFWHPKQPVQPGKRMEYDYSVKFGGPDITGEELAHAINTFIGDGNRIGGGNAKGAYRILVDFAGGPLAKLSPKASVVGQVTGVQGSEVLEHFVEYVPATRQWRLSILARPAQGKPLMLRAYLENGKQSLSETWTYDLPADNDILPGGG